MNKSNDDLTLEEIAKISNSLSKVSNLFICGGEPFLRKDLPEICEIFYKRNGLKFIFIPTNGLLTEKTVNSTKRLLKKCKKANVVISFSLDGLPETNDKIRGPASFNRCIKTLTEVSKLKKYNKNLSVYVNTVVTNSNHKEIYELFDFIKTNMDVDYHSFSPLRDLPLDQTLAPPSSRVWSKLFNKLIKFDEYYFSKKGQKGIILNIHLASKKYIYRIIARSLSGERWPFKCLSGEFIGVINPNGDVKLCESTETIGNLRKSDYNFKKVWFSEKANKMRRLKLEGKLKKCYGCTNACFLLPSLVYNPGHLMRVLVSPFV